MAIALSSLLLTVGENAASDTSTPQSSRHQTSYSDKSRATQTASGNRSALTKVMGTTALRVEAADDRFAGREIPRTSCPPDVSGTAVLLTNMTLARTVTMGYNSLGAWGPRHCRRTRRRTSDSRIRCSWATKIAGSSRVQSECATCKPSETPIAGHVTRAARP